MQARKHIFPDDFARYCHVIHAQKQIGYAMPDSKKRSECLLLSETPLYSGEKQSRQLSPQCGENLIVGEKGHSAEAMDVVKESMAKASEELMCGERFQFFIDMLRFRLAYSGVRVYVYKSIRKPAMNEQTSA
jgi:hypothetical protein